VAGLGFRAGRPRGIDLSDQAEPGDGIGQRLADRSRGEVEGGHAGAGLGEVSREDAAEPARGARDDDHAALERGQKHEERGEALEAERGIGGEGGRP